MFFNLQSFCTSFLKLHEFCMDNNGEIAKTSATPVNIVGDAKATKTFKVKHTSNYDETTNVKAYFLFTFNDGSTFKTPEHAFKVLVQPVFKFIKASVATTYEPDNEKTPSLSVRSMPMRSIRIMLSSTGVTHLLK